MVMDVIDVQEKAHCVVAVGSTQFEELIRTIDCSAFYDVLKSAGITGLLIQTGQGQYQPDKYPSDGSLKVEVHNFIVLEDYIKHAALLISHCGAGILLEGLRAETDPIIIAVVNTSLMNNH